MGGGRGAERFDDPRHVIPDEHARYFGVELNDQMLMPGDDARIGTSRYDSWLSHQRKQA